jgi:hypothetical protein
LGVTAFRRHQMTSCDGRPGQQDPGNSSHQGPPPSSYAQFQKMRLALEDGQPLGQRGVPTETMNVYVCVYVCMCVNGGCLSLRCVCVCVGVFVSCLCVFVVSVSAVVVVCSCIYQNIIGLPGSRAANQIASVEVGSSRPDYTPGQL